ncbi:hypothetical protein I3760_14G092600 [Carya illinoinensis]|uniref:Translation elongation factor EF1B beta/delta subunit guanine nucleotide exchange domain-containing protein n=1 Tax=Carya illinoinensis TaxID=32201 RepID=A0A922AJC4_CARIL|nr:hypothetical protein I3760_14G092600 [Carya illinoinensis]KAG6678690.1 hypothetical protein I3842_14G093400 [Carya illinoinensis]
MAVTFYDVNSPSGLKKLDDYLLTRTILKAPSAEYINVSRWFNHIDALLRISGVSGEGCGVTVEGSTPITGEAIATPPLQKTLRTFGCHQGIRKKERVWQSSVLLDVKPWDDETDMKKLEEAVRSVQMEGLFCGASKLVLVGYGIKKLQIMLNIVDDLVSLDTVIEERLTEEPINEFV